MAPASETDRWSVVSSYDAVLFDLDGTIADTDLAHGVAYKAAFAEIGLSISEDAYRKFAGQHSEQVIFGLSSGDEAIDRESLHQSKTRYFAEVAPRLVAPLPLLGLACSLRGLLPIAIVTSASRTTTKIVLEAISASFDFDLVLTGDDVIRHKPDPEPYRSACVMLGVRPEKCLAFEDSMSGIQSAQEAGVNVIGIHRSDVFFGES